MMVLNPAFYENKGKHAMFRPKCRWVENGERPTKYFYNLKNGNYNKMTISELRLQDESTTCNEKEIQDQIEAYFKNVYASENTLYRVESNKKGLDPFQNDKAPGVDGFTMEFYKFFYD